MDIFRLGIFVILIILLFYKRNNTFNIFLSKNTSKKKGVSILFSLSELNNKYGAYHNSIIINNIYSEIINIFGKNNIYQIKETDFYFFLKNKKYLNKKFNLLEKRLNNILVQYYLSLNIGYFVINDKVDINKTMEYALSAVKGNKSTKNFSYLAATKEITNKNIIKEYIKKALILGNLDEVYANYQPKINLQDNKIIGAEALARWNSLKFNVILPEDFISLAEELNLIYLIDYKIAEDSIKKIKNLIDENLISSNFKISFNLSRQTLEREDILNYITNLLKKYSISGKYIEIEITETSFGSNLNKIISNLEKLKKLDISLAIDDFSVGHSTIVSLASFPIDTIKFDKNLLSLVTKDNLKNNNIYLGLINLVKNLNYNITAEGIETQYQLDFLKSHYIKVGQGFLFYKPIPFNEFKKIIKSTSIG